MACLFVLLSFVVAYVLWSLLCIFRNYRLAAKIGLPILVCPVNPMGPLWMFGKDFLIPILSSLPFELGEWAERTEIGWTFKSRFSAHAKYGEAFVIVTPGENEIVLAEPAAAEDVVRRRNDFIKNQDVYGMLNIYGPNLDTVNGKDWDRHRKITVPPFNEQNSALVWRETAEQVNQMLKKWSGETHVASTQADVHALALNVLCGAGFGIHSSFVDTKLPEGDDQTTLQLGYRESLRLLLANIVQLVLLSMLKRAGVPDWLYYGSMRKVAVACEEFKRYMSEMLAQEKTAFEQGDVTRHNLMSALVRASEQSNEASKGAKEGSTVPTAGLSDDEVYGNLFIYNLAGHDTTAATVHFAVTLLAIYPEWQDWIAQEVDEVRGAESTGTWYYEETFPKLERCLSLMVRILSIAGAEDADRQTSTRPCDCTVLW